MQHSANFAHSLYSLKTFKLLFNSKKVRTDRGFLHKSDETPDKLRLQKIKNQQVCQKSFHNIVYFDKLLYFNSYMVLKIYIFQKKTGDKYEKAI